MLAKRCCYVYLCGDVVRVTLRGVCVLEREVMVSGTKKDKGDQV